MNKTLILGSRHTGKTYRIIHEAIDAQGIIICATESSKDHINSILRECNHTEVPVFTFAEMQAFSLFVDILLTQPTLIYFFCRIPFKFI